jgi:hypothetical protein
VSANEREIGMIGNRSLITLSLAIALGVLGAGSLAQAASDNNGGNETGGFVKPPNMVGVNPVYHPDWFPAYGRVMRSYDRANRSIYSGAGAYAFAPLATRNKHRSAR